MTALLLLLALSAQALPTLEEEYAALSDRARQAMGQRSLNARLFDAAEDCDAKRIQELIAAGAVPAYSARGPVFAAEAAAKCEEAHALHALYTHGASPDSPAYSRPLLDTALGRGREATAQLLARLVDPTRGLMIAIDRRRPDLARVFLRRGAVVERADPSVHRNVTALHAAALSDPETLSALLESGLDPDLPDAYGGSPLFYAIRSLRNRVDDSAVRLLLAAGADPDARDRNGVTPLLSAVLAGSARAAALLLAAGADPNRPVPTEDENHQEVDRTYLHRAGCDPGVVAALLAHGARRDAPDEKGRTPAEVIRLHEPADDEPCRETLALLSP